MSPFARWGTAATGIAVGLFACHGGRSGRTPEPPRAVTPSTALIGLTSGAILRAEAFPGATAGQKIAAAIGALPDSGGIVDATAFQGRQALDVDVFASVRERRHVWTVAPSMSYTKRAPGRLVVSSRASFEVSVTQHVPTSWTIEGYDPLSASETAPRAHFRLARSAGPVFDLVGVHHVVMRGLWIDCAETPESVGIHYDATNQTQPGTVASGQSLFEHIGIDGCQKAFEWGNDRLSDPGSTVRRSPLNSWGDDSEADTTYVRWVSIRSNLPGSIGFFVNGDNKANLSAIEHVSIENVTYGFYLAHLAPLLRIDDVTGTRIGFAANGGGCTSVASLPADGHFGRASPPCIGASPVNHPAPQPALFYLTPTDVLIRHSSSTGGCAKFVLLDNDACSAYLGSTVVLEHNTFSEPVETTGTAARILSIGNSGSSGGKADGASLFVTSLGDAPGLWHGSAHILVVPPRDAASIAEAMAPFDVSAAPEWLDVAPTYPLTPQDAMVSVRADLQPGADAGEKIAAAVAVLPAPGGTVDATGLTGYQEIRRDVFAGAGQKRGRLVLSPGLQALVTETQHLPSNWSIEGHPGGIGTGGDAAFGTLLFTAGPLVAILDAERATNVKLYGLQLHCGGFPESTGIRLDTERPSTTQYPGRAGRSVLEMLSIYDCSVGIDWGPHSDSTSAPAVWADHVWIRSAHVRSRNGASTGLRVSASQMKDAPLSVVDGLLAQAVTYGVHVEGSTPPLVIRELCGGSVGLSPAPGPITKCRTGVTEALEAGAHDAPLPSVLLVDAAPMTRIGLINSQSEGGCALHVNFRYHGRGSLVSPLVLLKDAFDEPVLVEAPEGGSLRIMSAGTRGAAASIADGEGLDVTAIEESRTTGGEANQWTCRNGARGQRFLAADPTGTRTSCTEAPSMPPSAPTP